MTPAQRIEWNIRAQGTAATFWPANKGPVPKVTVKAIQAGHAYAKKRAVSIPSWLFDTSKPIIWCGSVALPESERDGLILYYIAHELAHVLTPGDHHGPWFQAVLHEMCPEFYYFESTYKPRAYAAEMKRAAWAREAT